MTLVDGFAEPAREELLVRVADERAAWQELIEAAGGRVNEPGPAGDWTLRDVVAHINGYQRFLVGSMGGRTRDVPPQPEEIGFDVQKRNAWLHALDLDRTWELVATESRELHEELLAQLRARSQEQLGAPMVKWHPWPTWRWVIHLTHEHYQEHLPDLRRWLGLESQCASPQLGNAMTRVALAAVLRNLPARPPPQPASRFYWPYCQTEL